jgi:hypothetical protein
MVKTSVLLMLAALWGSIITATGNVVEIQPPPDIGQDTYVDRDSPTSNFSEGVVMKTLSIKYRAFLQFPQLNQYIGYEITAATLRMYLTMTTYGAKWFCRVLEPWDERMVTWNNQPAYSYTDYLEFTEEQQYKGNHHLDVTSMVRKWLSGEWENYGWAITTGDAEMWIYTSNFEYYYNRPMLVLEGPNLPPLSVQPTSLGKIKSLYSPQQVSSVEDGRGQFANHSKREAWARVE